MLDVGPFLGRLIGIDNSTACQAPRTTHRRATDACADRVDLPAGCGETDSNIYPAWTKPWRDCPGPWLTRTFASGWPPWTRSRSWGRRRRPRRPRSFEP